mgnify:CR=1 FL=1
MSLVTGKPVYTDDLAPRDCLIVKILRSPHANAWVEDIKTGTAEKVAEVEKALKDGTLQVFDTSKFTVKGETVTHAFALDTDGDFTPDAEEAVFDGAFHESYFQSAPYFTLQIDGIEWLNSAYGN